MNPKAHRTRLARQVLVLFLAVFVLQLTLMLFSHLSFYKAQEQMQQTNALLLQQANDNYLTSIDPD